MTILKFSQDLQELLANRDNWSKGHLARNSLGDWCYTYDEDAQCWCLLGGLLKMGDKHGKTYQRIAFSFLKKRCGNVGLTVFNDRATHESLMNVLRDLVKFATDHENDDPDTLYETLKK